MFEQRPQLAYDNLYKFYVSFGIATTIIPMILNTYILIRNPEIISQVDYDLLSEYTVSILTIQLNAYHLWTKMYPAIQICASFLGIVLLWIGLVRWNERQYVIDETENAHLAKLSPASEQDIKNIKEQKLLAKDKTSQEKNKNELAQRRLIERCAYEYIKTNYSHRLVIKRYQKLGNFVFDCVGISTSGKSDRLFEFIYIGNMQIFKGEFTKICKDMQLHALEYKHELHRSARVILVFITPMKLMQDVKTEVYSQSCIMPSNIGTIFVDKEYLFQNVLGKDE